MAVNPTEAHPAPSADGFSPGDLPLVEPPRELRGFPLGTILLRLGLVPEGPINEALAECEQTKKPLGRFLVERGMLDEAGLTRALAIQKGFPFVELEQIVPDRRATSLLSAHMANTHRALPLGYAGTTPVVAIGDPTNRDAIEEVCATIGSELVIAAADPAKLKEAIVAAYRPAAAPAPPPAHVVSIAVAPPVAPAPSVAVAPPPPPPAPQPAELDVVFRVVAVIDGERVDLAFCRTRTSADARAREIVDELSTGGWLRCDDRLVRAEAVVSIEIVETAVTP
ncbi:MAG TPA: hypothetical protein VF101_07970 [Gaiellaceae bacterium]